MRQWTGALRASSVVLSFVVTTAAFGQSALAETIAAGNEPSLKRRQFSTKSSALPEFQDVAPRNNIPPTYAPLRPSPALNRADELATLNAVQIALTEVADGATYVWHRRHGRLNGIVRPTSSFKEDDGTICRHIVLFLNSGRYSRRAEGIACQNKKGVWTLAD